MDRVITNVYDLDGTQLLVRAFPGGLVQVAHRDTAGQRWSAPLALVSSEVTEVEPAGCCGGDCGC